MYCDNFFSSPILFDELLQSKLYACGTIRQNRKGFPEDLKGNWKKDEKLATYRHILTVSLAYIGVTWKDNKVVTVLSSNVQPGEVDTCKRKQKNGTHMQLSCPVAVVEYVKYMRGVDQNDQLRTYYLVRLKSRKFYKYIFWFLFELAVTNAFVVYRTYSQGKTMKLREFRLELAKQLIGDYNSKKCPRYLKKANLLS